MKPKYVYRYRPLGLSLATALSEARGEIYCAPLWQLNDPFDGLSNVEPKEGKLIAGHTEFLGWFQWGQASFRKDLLSIWNLGAKKVIGVDINDILITYAKQKSDASLLLLTKRITRISNNILSINGNSHSE